MNYDTYNIYNQWNPPEFNYNMGQDFLPGSTINNLEQPVFYNNRHMSEKYLPQKNH